MREKFFYLWEEGKGKRFEYKGRNKADVWSDGIWDHL